MCTVSEPAVPSGTVQALAMVRAGLGYLSACDAASLGTPVQAEALIGLEQAEAQHTVARARLLAAFSAQQGHHADGQYGPAAWLRAFTSVTSGAAAGAVRWARRLAAHPLIAAALAPGSCPRRGPGRCASGPISCPKSAGTTRTPLCWPPPAAGPGWRIWPRWPSR